jgi:hypothetical protein
MSRKQPYTKPVVVPAATIDLHGYKRDEGIAAVTAFVESSQRQFPPPTDAWVCIITGSGHHSPSGMYMHYYCIRVSFFCLFERADVLAKKLVSLHSLY